LKIEEGAVDRKSLPARNGRAPLGIGMKE